MKQAKACSYCGKMTTDWDMEHIIPACLYPQSKHGSRIQRLTVPACKDCNRSWQDDEVHFRSMLLIAGEPNAPVKELWDTTRRSFTKKDGVRRLTDLVLQMKPVETRDGPCHMVYPGKDKRVVRIVRKIIRGLCHYHDLLSAVADHRVWADVRKFVIPKQFLKLMSCNERERDIIEYRYAVLNQEGIHSVWLLTFFERRKFIGLVSASENGFENSKQSRA